MVPSASPGVELARGRKLVTGAQPLIFHVLPQSTRHLALLCHQGCSGKPEMPPDLLMQAVAASFQLS